MFQMRFPVKTEQYRMPNVNGGIKTVDNHITHNAAPCVGLILNHSAHSVLIQAFAFYCFYLLGCLDQFFTIIRTEWGCNTFLNI